MVVPVSILFGIVVEITERLAQEQNIVRLAGQKRPAWSYSMLLGERLEILRRVFLRTQGDGVKENVAADAALQQSLHFDQVMGNHRADVFAARKHELDHHASVLDQIGVEVNLLIVLRDQFHVGQVTPLDKLARRDILEVVVVFARRGRFLCEQTGCPGETGCPRDHCSCSSSRQQFSSCHPFHNLCSFLFVLRLLQLAARLGILVVVSHAWLHLEEQHHGVIFVNGVVAVHGPVPLEVTEAEEEGSILIELKLGDILARHLHVGNTSAGGADAGAPASKWAVAARAEAGIAAAVTA